NGKLLLLAAVIGLFVRVWNSNEQRHVRSIPGSRARISQKVLARTIAYRNVPNSPGIEAICTPATAPIPVPAGITPGRYRVIDDTGRVALLIVPAKPISPAELRQSAEINFFVESVGTAQWHFLRLQSETTVAAVGDAAAPVRGCDLP